MRIERTRTAVTAVTAETAVTAIGLLAVLALAGCTAQEPAPDAVPDTATGTLEQLAERVDCTPRIQTDAEELRQANCATADGTYVLATFATDRGQREWLNSAKDYGGSYLVGRKWVAVAGQDVITKLRGRLGGEIESAEGAHSGHHGS
ncbi:hypothetical protein [Streptomyces sp. TRM64462]|uniref:hypothetical protein n=1 Tax=Streptomyces sp. TRM64462 TaxID=2741726 RepID=UPI0015868DB6|nr:hypothetical protein [Streptomyces sp. TRM64462]